MQKFLDQFFTGNTMMALNMEIFIFQQAGKVVEGYNGGNWTSQEINGARILNIPGSAEQHTINVEMSGNSVTTDKVSASAAFTSLIVNWFWHVYARSMTTEEFERFSKYHYTLRDALYSDEPTTNLDTDAIFTLTD